MQARIEFTPARHQAVYRAMLGLQAVVRESLLDPYIIHLVRLRVSQINGCGYCIDMHTKDARADGETEQRLYLVGVWREAPLYSERERAALAWAEAVTRLDGGHVADEVFTEARRVFTDQELAVLTLAVVEINGWNRFAISFGLVPGSYRLGEHPRLEAAGASA